MMCQMRAHKRENHFYFRKKALFARKSSHKSEEVFFALVEGPSMEMVTWVAVKCLWGENTDRAAGGCRIKCDKNWSSSLNCKAKAQYLAMGTRSHFE
jgi:hypothetical protein